MKKHTMPEMKEGGVNVTPLIDVVMCLIIFFMLVAKIGVKTGAAKMDLPQTIIGKKIDELGDNIILNVFDPNIARVGDWRLNKDGSLDPRTQELMSDHPDLVKTYGQPQFKSSDTENFDWTLLKDPPGSDKPIYFRRHMTQPQITAAFNENDKNPAEIPIVRDANHQLSYPLRDALKTAVEARKRKNADDKFSITIRAEKDLDYSMLQQVLIECANAGVKNLNYGSVSKKTK